MIDIDLRGERHSEGRQPSRQLTLDLAGLPSYHPDDFLVSASNAEAHAMIRRWPHWSDRVLLVIGEAGTGKSHLGAIWATRAGAATIATESALASAARAEKTVALIEDGDRRGFSETDLFHVMNAARAGGGWLVITARKPPDLWALRTRDLLSRLRLAVTIRLDQPDTALLAAVLVKHFHDRQIHIDADVAAFAALHCERSLGAVRSLVAAVDAEALSSGRKITRRLTAQAIERLRREEEDRGSETAAPGTSSVAV